MANVKDENLKRETDVSRSMFDTMVIKVFGDTK